MSAEVVGLVLGVIAAVVLTVVVATLTTPTLVLLAAPAAAVLGGAGWFLGWAFTRSRHASSGSSNTP